MDESLRRAAEAARGFMPPDEGLALHDAAAGLTIDGPMLEIGSYCGKSALYLGAAARQRDTVLFSVDHHRGSEENQAGWEWHEPDLVDPEVGRIDTLPIFRRTIHDAALEGTVIAVVADSPTLAKTWTTPLALLFIDGGHGTEPAHRDYELWTPHVKEGGLLLIHDVFPDPADGGRPPYEIYCRALESKRFEDLSATGSLRVLRSVAVER
jgi:predicted O-methyltransferase YrrM